MSRRVWIAGCVAFLLVANAGANSKGGGPLPPAVKASALTSIPVKELAIFKDGHAFVLHEADVATNEAGDVVIDTLPTPVIGTFWPYAADPVAKFRAAIAGRRKVETGRDALSTRELLENNAGAEVFITQGNGARYAATIVGIPNDEPREESSATAVSHSNGEPPQQPGTPSPPNKRYSNIILLKVQEGVRVVPIDQITEVVFATPPKTTTVDREDRGLLTLKLDWGGKPVAKTAHIGMVYLQKGVRWIPNYRVDIDGAGKAHVKLQGTIINELVDLQDVTAHLVIGVPTFYFRDTLDPMALDQTLAQLSSYFQQRPAGMGGQSFSNVLAGQSLRMGEYRARQQAEAPAAPVDAIDPEIGASARDEDLFLFEVKNLTLRKGERMIVPIAEFDVSYEDVFVLDVPFAPPAEMQPNVGGEQMADMLAMLRTPKVMHRLRLENKSHYPLTTAPAIIFRDNRLLAQSLMTYTAVGGKSDVDLTAAVDIQVSKTDIETGRKPDAMKWAGYDYGRIDMQGTLCLTNHRENAVKLEVRRRVLGEPVQANHDGQMVRTNLLEADWPGAGTPYWWYWYSWPNWWYHLNGAGRFDWNLELKAGEKIELTYAWQYYWR